MKIKHRSQLGELLKFMNLPLIIVEVGVAEGLFAKNMMDWGAQILYLVDRWETDPTQRGDGGFAHEWHEDNLQQVQDRMSVYDNRPEKYVILQGDSEEMAQYIPDNSLSMTYIDCDHSYEGVKGDIEAYYPKVVTGGILAFHDFADNNEGNGYGVERAVREFCALHNYEVILIPENQPCDSGAYFIKQ